MDRSELKKYVTKVLLEKLEQSPVVEGKLIKKTINYHGISRVCVSEGNIQDINNWASTNLLKFTSTDCSYFGGHYIGEMTSYEFEPNPEFYGELMETSMSTREQLSRICGTNDKILNEVDADKTSALVEFIYTDDVFYADRTSLVFERIENSVTNRLYDKHQYVKLFEYLINQATQVYTSEHTDLSKLELEHTLQLLSKRFFTERLHEGNSPKTNTMCGKKSFKAGTAFENMQRITSDHQMFL